MEERNLLIICITAIICVAIISGVLLYIHSNNNNQTTNNTTNQTTNITLNETNNTNNTTTTTTKKTTKKTTKSQSTEREEDKITPDGWDPKKHEVSREKVDSSGNERVYYDDGYSRLVDKKGNILSYGY